MSPKTLSTDMASRAASSYPKGLAKGVILEILWDIERYPVDGRSATEKVTESVWWRATVLEIGHEEENLVMTVKYDSMFGFKSQNARLHVYPSHVQSINGKEVTQLRWRFLESAGSTLRDSCDEDNGMPGCIGDNGSGGVVARMQHRIEKLSGRVQQVEKLALSEREISARVSRSLRADHDRMEGLLGLLRQKLAYNAQRPLTLPRGRHAGREGPMLIDYSYTGLLRAATDCNADEFETLCRLIRNQGFPAHFKANNSNIAPCIDALKESTSVAEVLFGSLKDLCDAIGISQQADRMAIALRKRGTSSIVPTHDVSLRICGTLLAERWRDDTPVVILLCQGLHDKLEMNSEVVTLSREDKILDPRTVWYKKPLRLDRSPVSEALGAVFSSTLDEDPKQIPLSSNEYAYLVQNLAPGIGRFALRWKPLPNLNTRLWTRKLSNPSTLFGTLEVEVPYLHLRGINAVRYVENILSKSLFLEIIN